MALMDWSSSANSNSVVGSINWAEGMPPSAVNNSARQMMADVADWTNNPGPEWYQYDSATYASGTTFTVPGNQTARYVEGRRVRAVVTGGTYYGSVVSSTFGTNTTTTVNWDSGSLDSGLSSLKLSTVTPTGMPTKGVVQHIDNAVSISTTAQIALALQTNTNGVSMTFKYSGGAKLVGVDNSNAFIINNSANTINCMKLTDAGAATFAGDVAANSDERMKTAWQDLPDDFIEQLAGILRARTYEMYGHEGRHAGVGAQSLREILPEAVMTDQITGRLSVAYGNAALVACVMLSRRVAKLTKRIEELEGEQ